MLREATLWPLSLLLSTCGWYFFNIKDDNDFRQDRYLNNIDPDMNYMSSDTCNYTINADNIITKSTDELTIMNFNIRSIKKNFSDFEQLLSGIKCKIHIICITESWLRELDNIKDFELE